MGKALLRDILEVDIMRGIENTSGPLGQGHTFAVGAAIAAKFLKARFNEVMNRLFTHTFPMVVFRKKSLRVPDALPVHWDWTT